MTDTDTVRALMSAYLANDAETAQRLIAPEFVFTSPQDDHIDRAAYFERCFPTAERLESQHILQATSSGDGGVFLRYEYALKDGGRFRNCEYITVRDGQLTEVEVYFGGAV